MEIEYGEGGRFDFLKKDWFLILLLLFIVLVIYFPSFGGRLFFDDEYFIVRNSYVHNFDLVRIFSSQAYAGAGQAGSFYRPLQFVCYSIIYQFLKINPIPYHLFSVLFHFGSAVLLFLLLRDFKISKLIAFFSSLLFVVHPINTQAVSYVSGLGEPLGLFFLLLAFLVYRKENFFKNKFYAYSLFFLFIILSLLSKERSVIFLFLFFIMEISFPKEKKSFKDFIKNKKIFISISILIILFYFFIIKSMTDSLSLGILSFGADYSSNIFIRFLTFLHSFFEYFQLIFFPVGLYSERPFEIFTNFFNIKIICSLAILSILLFFSFYKSKYQKVLFFSFFWFIIALIPSSGIVPLYYTIKEHWIYYSMIGFCFGFTYSFFKIIKNKKIAITIFILICLLLSVGTFSRNSQWANPKEFFQNELKHNPNSENAIANLAYEYYLENDIDNAIELYKKGINITKSNQLAMMYYNLGYMYSLEGEINKSILFYNKALEIDPNYLYALEELSKYYYKQNDTVNFNRFYSRFLMIQEGTGI